jgi:lysophospholipase L1-like esterase
MGPMPATPAFHDLTIRQILRVSAGGEAIRLRLSNAFGTGPLAIGRARVAILGPDGKEQPNSSRWITFDGQSSAIIPQGAPFVSDAVALNVPAFARLAVSLYLPGDTGPCTCHTTGLEPIELSAPGNHSAAPFAPVSTAHYRAFLMGVELDDPAGAGTIVAFGDSITDGVGSTAGADRRWPDLLAERLKGRWGVANAGISGNRVLNDGFGINALARLDRDALALPGVKAIILLEGVNDLGIAFARPNSPLAKAMHQSAKDRIDADRIIAGYRQIVTRAHARGIKVYGATILPYKGATYWSPEGEAARQEINAFIRSKGAFDGVIDFDAATRDPADPQRMREGFHAGDHLHGSDAGYQAMANAIPLDLFE